MNDIQAIREALAPKTEANDAVDRLEDERARVRDILSDVVREHYDDQPCRGCQAAKDFLEGKR